MKKYIIYISVFGLLFLTSNSTIAQDETSVAWKFYELAEKSRVLKKYKTAITEYESAILINDQKPTFYLGLGLCYAQTKRFNEAANVLEKGLLLNPKNDRIYSYLFKAYKSSARKDKAVDVLDRWSKNTEDSEISLAKKLQAIDILVASHDYLGALIHTREALLRFDNNIDALYYHARVNNKLGNFEEAKVSATKAADLLVENFDKASEVYYELGFALHHLGEYDAKDAVFKKITNDKYRPLIARLYAPYFTNLATVYTQIFEFNIAQALLNEALKIDEHYSRANKLYAKIEEKKPSDNPAKEAHKREVIEFYKKGIKGILAKASSEPMSEKIKKELYKDYRYLIELKIATGAFDEAIYTSNEAMQLFSTPNYMHKFNFLKAIALFKKDQPDISVLTLQEAIATTALPIEYKRKYSFMIGHINHTLGNLDEAQIAYQRALKSKYGIAAHYGLQNIDMLESSNGMILESDKIPLAQIFKK